MVFLLLHRVEHLGVSWDFWRIVDVLGLEGVLIILEVALRLRCAEVLVAFVLVTRLLKLLAVSSKQQHRLLHAGVLERCGWLLAFIGHLHVAFFHLGQAAYASHDDLKD